jgi:transposase
MLRSGDLTAIRVPTPDEEAVRDLVRAREDVRKDLVAARHRLSKFLLRHGRHWHQITKWTEGFWKWVHAQTFEQAAARLTFEHYVSQIEHLLSRREEIDRSIEGVAAQDTYRDSVARLSCLRGISLQSAMGLLAEIQDFRRFRSPRELMAFLGLVPSEFSSGGKQARGGITKTGNAHARRLLVEAAWTYRHVPRVGPRIRKALVGQPADVSELARKAQRRLHQRYRHLLGRGKRAPVAVTAVARELCGFAWALMVARAA